MTNNNEYIKQFISTIIPDIKYPKLNCNGSLDDGGYMIDDGLAYGYYSNLKHILKSDQLVLKLYGGTYNKEIQILNIEEYGKYLIKYNSVQDNDKLEKIISTLNTEISTKSIENKYLMEATSIFSQNIDIYLRGNIIGDDFFQLLMQLLEYVDVFEIEYEGRTELVFVNKIAKQVKATTIDLETAKDGIKSKVTGKTVKKTFDILLHKPINQLNVDEFRYNNIMLLLKEVKEGFVDMRLHSLALKDKKNRYELHEYKIGEDIEIILDTESHEIISIDKHETKYTTTKKELGIWVVNGPNTVDVPTDDFKYFEVEQLEGTRQKIKLYGAYTHILRDILGFKPQTWQYKFLINQNRINYVAGVRRGGKTLLSSYLIIRFLYRQPSSQKHILRQPKGIYTITSKDKFKAVLDYIESQSNRIKVLKSLVYIKKQDRLILSDDKLDFSGNKYLDIQSTYDFISSKGYKTGVGSGGDDIIIDEASSVSEDVWLNLAPIVTNEGANLFCISTIDWTTPKQWFYSNLVQAERGVFSNTYAQRVTIDDIDENIMNKDAKEHAKSVLSHNMARYLGELYATFSSESQVFSSEGSIILEDPKDTYEQIIIGYDPAKRSDFGAVVVCGVLKGTLYFVEEYQLQGDYSTYQKSVIFDVKKKYLDKQIKTTLIMDGTANGDIVAEILGNIVDFKIWYTGDGSGAYKPKVDDYGSWKVSKTRLVTTAQVLFETKRIKINSSLVKLQGEIQTFKSYVSNGKYKYDAIQGEHDDLVNGLLLCCFYYGYIDGNISYLTKDNDIQYRNMFKSYIDNKTGKYKEYFKTIRKGNNNQSSKNVGYSF